MASKVARLRAYLENVNVQPTVTQMAKLTANDVLDALSPLQLDKHENFIRELVTGDFQQASLVIDQVVQNLQAVGVCNEGEINVVALHANVEQSMQSLLEHDLSPLEELRRLCLDIVAKPLSSSGGTLMRVWKMLLDGDWRQMGAVVMTVFGL